MPGPDSAIHSVTMFFAYKVQHAKMYRYMSLYTKSYFMMDLALGIPSPIICACTTVNVMKL